MGEKRGRKANGWTGNLNGEFGGNDAKIFIKWWVMHKTVLRLLKKMNDYEQVNHRMFA